MGKKKKKRVWDIDNKPILSSLGSQPQQSEFLKFLLLNPGEFYLNDQELMRFSTVRMRVPEIQKTKTFLMKRIYYIIRAIYPRNQQTGL